MANIEINDDEFKMLKEHLHMACGIDVPPEKKYLFKTRLSSFMYKEGYKSFTEFYNRLYKDEDETLGKYLVEAMTTNETSFFRDSHPFQALEKVLLPEIAAKRIEEAVFLPPSIRIWSAGCSTGQEPYSIAMAVCEWLKTQSELTVENVRIIATDVSSRTITVAKQGVYSAEEVKKHIPPGFVDKYLHKKGDGWQINDDIRSMVNFAELNLSVVFDSLGRFDIVFCRNVMIYFSKDLRQNILQQFNHMLNEDGVLILGASETLYALGNDFVADLSSKTIVYRPNKSKQKENNGKS